MTRTRDKFMDEKRRSRAKRLTHEEAVERPIIEPDDADHIVIERVCDYYHATLKESAEALAYLKKRGLTHPDLLESFRLGFANRSLGLRIPKVNRRAGWALRSQLQRIGILRDTGHEHFHGAITVPIHDADGRIVQVYGRLTTRSPKRGARQHLYLAGPPRGVFNRQALTARDAIVCKGAIDALTCWCNGLPNATCSWGLDGFTGEHLDAFIDHGVERVFIAFDRTTEGDKAAQELSERLADKGMQVFRVVLPQGLDLNAYATSDAGQERGLDVLVRNATWLAGTRPAPVPEEIASKPEHASLPAPTLLASPAPVPVAEEHEHEVVMRFGDRRWRIRGLDRNTSFERMKVNILVSREHPEIAGFHVDTLELYSARQRAVFIRDAALELGHEERVLKADLAKVLLDLERLQEEHMRRLLEPNGKADVVLTDSEREAAFELLRDPNLVERVLGDYERCGLVGERDNALIGYLAATSRLLDDPLAIIVQSSSAAGKSSLMEAVLSFVPEQARVSYSAMTPQSLYYVGERDLAHKVLAVSEGQGAEEASYALKLLQSERTLTIASTGKDPRTGRLSTLEYRVFGPVMLFLTTTNPALDEELLNRCLVLTVDEGAEQTRKIHEVQRRAQTLEGLLAREHRTRIGKLHQNAQRLLQRIAVVNPYAPSLSFGATRTRTRRDHPKYLTLIRAIALLHQHQRPVHEVEYEGTVVRYIEVTEHDIEVADRLFGVLRQGLGELPPQTERLLALLQAMVAERVEREGIDPGDVRFSRREVRAYTAWGHTQVRLHLARLQEHEYLYAHAGGARRRTLYELSSLDAACTYDADLAGSWRGHGGGRPRQDLVSTRADFRDVAGVAGGTSQEATSLHRTVRTFPALGTREP